MAAPAAHTNEWLRADRDNAPCRPLEPPRDGDEAEGVATGTDGRGQRFDGGWGPAPGGSGPWPTGPLQHPSGPLPVPPYAVPRPAASRTPIVVAVTVVVLAVLALVGVLLYPRLAANPVTVAVPAPVALAPSTVVVPRTVTVTGGSGGGYSCGSANGYDIWVNNGTVPCTSARLVTSRWTSTGTTPENGDGPAGTPYSWSCSSASGAVGLCTSTMGSTFTISS